MGTAKPWIEVHAPLACHRSEWQQLPCDLLAGSRMKTEVLSGCQGRDGSTSSSLTPGAPFRHSDIRFFKLCLGTVPAVKGKGWRSLGMRAASLDLN